MQREARNSVLRSRKHKLAPACRQVLIDQLESRVLLSTGGTPDPGFGQGGYLKGYQVLAVQQDGSLIASKDSTSGPPSLVLLHPDGSFESTYSGPAPKPTPTNVQADGKYLVINGTSFVSGNTLTRYNPDGSVDTSFGNNGTVSDFTSDTGYPAGAFNPENVTVVGNHILVGGLLDSEDEFHNSLIALVQLNPDGSIDHTFGSSGIAKGPNGNSPDVKTYEMLVGPNGNYFVAGEIFGFPTLAEFTPAGATVNQAELQSAGEDHVYGLGFSRNTVYMLADWTPSREALAAYDLNLNVDTGFGTNGVVVVIPPDHSPSQSLDGTSPGPMIVDPDGRIFVSGRFDYGDGSGGNYAIAYLPDWGANTSVSGFIYHDANGNGKMDPSESAMRYWQAFVDLNGNGTYDAGEPTAYSDYNGYYKIHGLDPGTYKVYEVMPSLWTLTEPPATAYHSFAVSSGQVSTGNDFGNHLYGAPGGDPSFGENGAVFGYTAQQVLPNGIIVAHDSSGKLVGLNPDGSIDSSFNPATDIPPTSLPGLYQSDGKRLVFDTSTRTITRYNADGTVDTTFGNNGSVSNFPQQPTSYLGDNELPEALPYHDTTFTPKFIALQGNDIIVAGALDGQQGTLGRLPTQLGVERLNSNGSEDTNFGLVAYRATQNDDVLWQGLFVANGGQIYAAGTDADANVRVVRLSPNGTSGIQGSAGDGDAVISGMAMGPDGRLVIVTDEGEFDEVTRLNADLTPGGLNRYILKLVPSASWDPTARSTYIVGDPIISADGKVLLNATYTEQFTDDQKPINLLVRLPAEVPSGSGSISGYIYNDANGDGVHDSGDLPLRYAQAFVDLNGNGKFDLGEPTAYADYNGYYKIYGVAPGSYQVDEVPQAGYSQDAPSATPYRTVTVTAGNTSTGVDFGNRAGTAPQPGSISGTFFYDSNTNGVWDSGEAPSPYWGVYIDANNDGKYDSGDTELIANGAGQYTFNNLAPGTYIVRGTTASGWTQTFPANGGGQTVTVGSGQAVTGINIGEFHGTVSTAKGSISGTFFYDSNTNGTWDSGEAPSPYWGVYIDANDDGTYDSGDTEMIANGAGQYTFNNLAPGTYIVRGTTASGWTQTFPANSGAQTVTVGSGQAITGINFGEFHGTVPTANGSISGTFFYDSNHNGVWDSGEPISPYWGVYIDANNDGKYDSGDTELICNGQGQFTFPNLPAGTYVIRGTTASGWTQTSPANGGAQVVTLAAGQNLSNINFGEYHGIVSSGATGSISGTFFYDSNANGIWDSGETYSPSWGVYIDANDDGVYDSGDTELIATAHGHYTFSNLSAGTYVIRATTASGWKQTYPANGGAQVITLASGQNATGVNFGKVRT